MKMVEKKNTMVVFIGLARTSATQTGIRFFCCPLAPIVIAKTSLKLTKASSCNTWRKSNTFTLAPTHQAGHILLQDCWSVPNTAHAQAHKAALQQCRFSIKQGGNSAGLVALTGPSSSLCIPVQVQCIVLFSYLLMAASSTPQCIMVFQSYQQSEQL